MSELTDYTRKHLLDHGRASNTIRNIETSQAWIDLKVGELSPLDTLTTLFELQRKAKGE